MIPLTSFQVPAGFASQLTTNLSQHLAAASDSALPAERRVQAAASCLETVAALDDAALDVPTVTLPESLISHALTSLDPNQLLDAADDLLEQLNTVLDDPFDESVEQAANRVESLLLLREQFDRRPRGASLAGSHQSLSPQQTAAIEYFDTMVHPMSWALGFCLQARDNHTRQLHPSRRKTAWWWTASLDVDWNTVLHTVAVADLLERFPTFGTYLQELRTDARKRIRFMASDSSSRPNDSEESADSSPPLALAAAPSLPDGASRLLAQLAPAACLFLERQSNRLLARLAIEPVTRVAGSPSITLANGSCPPAHRDGDDWLYDLGTIVPQSIRLRIHLDGAQLDRDIRLDPR